jgi:hypothetical protein
MLKVSTKPGGLVFDGTNLRKEWAKACVAAGLGVQEPVDKAGNRRYHGLLLHDLRRSAIKNMMKLGIQQKVARTISGHKADAVFERYNIIDETDVLAAMKHVGNAAQIAQKSLMSSSVKVLGENPVAKSRRKRLTGC